MIAAHAAEDQAEGRRPEQDRQHHRRGAQGVVADLAEGAAVQPPLQGRQGHGPDGANRTGFRRGGQAKKDAAQHQQDQTQGWQQHPHQFLAAGPIGAGIGVNGGCQLGLQAADDDHVEGEARGHQQPRDQRAQEEVTDGDPQLVGEHHQDDARRNDLAQGARGGDHAGGQRAVVARPQHHGQGDQSHRRHRGGDHAGGGGEQCPDQDHRQREAAADAPQQLPHRHQQAFSDARALEHRPHEDEGRNRQQREVAHDPEDPLGQGREELGVNHPKGHPQQGKQHRDAAQAEGDRIAAQ